MNDLPDHPDRIPPDLHSLKELIEALERNLKIVESRVDALEHPLAAHLPHPPEQREPTLVAALPPEKAVQAPNLFPVAGRAMLGIAGAYVLRAVEQMSAIPDMIVAVAGILYAFLWLIWAARVRSGPRVTSSIYAGTSALILAPMLWELTLRFHVLTSTAAAATICCFALTSLVLAAIAHKQSGNLKPVVRVAYIAAAALALALAVATHEFLPFVVALLFLAAICEFAPVCDRAPEVAAIIALATDAAVWLLIFNYFAGQAAQEGYPPLSRAALLAPGIVVFVLFAASIGVKTMLRAQKITIFGTVQTMLAFLLAAISFADIHPPAGARILGTVCLVLSAVCYVAVFTVFARAPEPRNRTIFGAWAATLLLAGGFLGLPPLFTILLLGAAAVGAVVLSRQDRWAVFEFYGMVFLLAASAASGLLSFLKSAVVGAPAGASAAGVWVIAVCAIFCYALVRPLKTASRIRQTLDLLFATLAISSITALLIDGLVALIALRAIPGAHHLALVRTAVLCTAALALVFSGARFSRQELTRLGYTALALVGIKLVTEDLRNGHLAYIAASIFLVAFTLIAAPRMARGRQKA